MSVRSGLSYHKSSGLQKEAVNYDNQNDGDDQADNEFAATVLLHCRMIRGIAAPGAIQAIYRLFRLLEAESTLFAQ